MEASLRGSRSARAHCAGALHSRIIENRMTATKKAKARRFVRIVFNQLYPPGAEHSAFSTRHSDSERQ